MVLSEYTRQRKRLDNLLYTESPTFPNFVLWIEELKLIMLDYFSQFLVPVKTHIAVCVVRNFLWLNYYGIFQICTHLPFSTFCCKVTLYTICYVAFPN